MDKKIFATLAIATVLASCTSDLDGIDETPANPKPIRRCTAVVDLSVQAPTADATTQTPSGANGPRRASAETADKDTVSLSLPDEYKVHNVVLYLYNAQTGNFADSIHLTRFAGLDKTEHGTMCFRSDSIRLEPGDYRVYAVANAPTAAGKIGNDQSLLTTVAKGKSIMSVIGTEGLTMSNRGGSAQNVRVSTDSVTHIEIALERAVAKVEIGKRFGSYELKDKNGSVYAKVTPGSFYFVNLSRDYYLFRHTGKFDKVCSIMKRTPRVLSTGREQGRFSSKRMIYVSTIIILRKHRLLLLTARPTATNTRGVWTTTLTSPTRTATSSTRISSTSSGTQATRLTDRRSSTMR